MTIKNKYQFIIIDDHPFFRDGVKKYLADHEQYELINEFSETRHLLNASTQYFPDFILLDLNIPGLEGRASCLQLKKKFPNCKIIALTQYTGIQDELAKLQFDGYVVKDDSPANLLTAIETVLQGKTHFPAIQEKDDKKQTNQPDDHLRVKHLNISQREIEIIRLVIQGFSNPEIANKLCLSELTIKTHRKNFYSKAGVRKIPDLIKFMQNHGLAEH
ncbi:MULTISPECIES: response regulator [Niastella]|uniref:Response regulator transcription factor n=1 Tax=Niastella soli TaxID=2821487 RepID=A0ABS3Z2K0_9BACT|nr:response regulator transcription factor [Niastella soli]MBO9204397.1 response regulator transcription factor [Niastella soli]